MREGAGENRPSPALKASALLVLATVFVGAAAAYLPLADHLSFDHDIGIAAAALLLVIFVLVFNGLQHHRHQSFGLANAVTAVRAAMVSLVAAAVFYPAASQSIANAPWSFVVFVLVALALDGFDGHLARRYEQVSDLGARFDMEIDALLILCLSAAAFFLGKAGAWVLLIGLMRYGFVLAQYPVPRLAGELHPTLRRKLVCVVQIAALCAILLPFVTAPVSSWLAALALLLLSYSFAVDCLYLLSGAGEEEE
ncbi:CDP-alcohol phosphatidyltransferase family protein [Rhizobium sp. GN54]|uniref:CDP-alcohol phosphatidyltransferase family protein n=1 Tax=Rhizobium sp. GN54 TaxID=2898150 RepID=UPI001E64419A|nr:CDP-alcohol phosphatidyltransferase family protein [Rhizobium sp. GN54]MCD2184660.1 CDP-alcohol phosphatidyltransferase family protein [Rhizobium sp. GN54]